MLARLLPELLHLLLHLVLPLGNVHVVFHLLSQLQELRLGHNVRISQDLCVHELWLSRILVLRAQGAGCALCSRTSSC